MTEKKSLGVVDVGLMVMIGFIVLIIYRFTTKTATRIIMTHETYVF